MTEDANTLNSVSEDLASNNQQNVQQSTESSEQMIAQSRVNDIVAANKKAAQERGYRQAMAEFNNNGQQHSAPSASTQYAPGVSQEDVKSIIAEQLKAQEERLSQERYQADVVREAQRVQNELNDKFAAAREKIPDLDNYVNDGFLVRNAELAFAANNYPNAAEMLHHLSGDLSKLGAIKALDPGDQARALALLSKSLTNNEISKSIPVSNRPISHATHSSTMSPSGSKRTMNDFREIWKNS